MTSPPPLTGLHVVELAGLAPVPYAGLLLADYGASVLRIDRPHPHAHNPSHRAPRTSDTLTRNKSSIALDLKRPSSHALLLSVLSRADVLIEPFRPGVLESLGLAPLELIKRNPRLIVARLTGFRRDGKYAKMAGHDINYLAVSGVLSLLGRKGDAPYPPANLLADFAGGGLMCAFGILLALMSRSNTGKGQVVEANMVDGVGSLSAMPRFARKSMVWDQPRGENALDGGSPYYGVYECKDGGYVAVGALEEQFFAELVRGLELQGRGIEQWRLDRGRWGEMKGLFEKVFKGKTRKEWEEVFDGKDACVTPVLGLGELEESGYDVREAVGLRGSPAVEVKGREGWNAKGLGVGEGGDKVLKEWMGWEKGRQFEVEKGALVKKEVSKL
ncbi:MAG: hypothetical protein MMC23_007860 [Stictis urceolatum]|nr:hypothetical protein [Stictis urceolata]